MNVPFVDLKAQYQSIKSEIDDAITNVIQETAFVGGRNNTYVSAFENEFAAYIGTKHCVSCANGTDSLEIVLKAYGIGPGDEVLVPALTWISTAEAVGSVGAIPVFVDIHPDYYTLDVRLLESKINAHTKAIIPVHLYGLPAQMDEIMALAEKYKLIVVEDCAQAHGAEYKEAKVGTIGHAASFSFYPGKNMGAYGDAGCIVTNDDNIAERCRMIANHGQIKKHQHIMEGRNSRMDGMQAAILSVKLKYIDNWNEQRIENAAIYRTYIKDENVIFQNKPDFMKHVYHIFSIQVERRDELLGELKKKYVDAAIHYPHALPFLDAYQHFGYSLKDFPVAGETTAKLISLPMFPELTEEQIKYVSEIINELLDQ